MTVKDNAESPHAREHNLKTWARSALTVLTGADTGPVVANALGGDASFRRYFRYLPGQSALPESLMLVDAPPQRENNPAFVLAASEFRAAGLCTPQIYASDIGQGFMILEDFGDQLYLPCLQRALANRDTASADNLYQQAMSALLDLQANQAPSRLPSYSQALLHQELTLFDQWFCAGMLDMALKPEEQALLASTWDMLEQAALAQTQVRVHRDYHSRNLMVRQAHDGSQCDNAAPGIIDFQDAVIGPVTYDLVSLLRDCYIVWPDEQVQLWLQDFMKQARSRGILPEQLSDAKFSRDFDLMGLQRHIKVLGIFCRLALRDGKTRYLDDLPVVMDYVCRVAVRHPEMEAFLDWFRAGPEPAMRRKLAGLSL